MFKKENNKIEIKIKRGLDLVFKKLLEDKKAKNSKLVILRDNKIVMVKPEELGKM